MQLNWKSAVSNNSGVKQKFKSEKKLTVDCNDMMLF